MSRQSEGMGWGARLGIGVVVLVIFGTVGLAIYAGRVTPPQHSIEQVLPNDRFPT
jgi:hypothetical protein